MSLLESNIGLVLPIIAILALISLASSQPSRSAIILLLEAILIDVYIGISHGITSTIFGASILLSFFCLIIIGSNFYFEISFKKTSTKPPKLNIIISFILFFIFWYHIKDLFSATEFKERLYFLNLNYDGLSILIAGFALFAILASSLIIFDFKNPKSGDHS